MARIKSAIPLKVAFIGNSLTQGYYATSEANRFSNRVLARVKATQNAVMYNHGVAGAKVADHIAWNTAAKVNAECPDICIIELGTNDLSANDLVAFRANMTTLISSIRAPRIVLVTTWGPDREAYDAVIKDIAAAKGCLVADIYSIHHNNWAANTTGSTDNWHPNDTGHLNIATVIFNVIQPFIADGARGILSRIKIARQKTASRKLS